MNKDEDKWKERILSIPRHNKDILKEQLELEESGDEWEEPLREIMDDPKYKNRNLDELTDFEIDEIMEKLKEIMKN